LAESLVGSLLLVAQKYFCHFVKPIPPKNLKADSKYTLLLARYPVHLLHDLILGVLLGSFLVIGLQSPPSDSPTLILKLDEQDTLVHEPDQAPTLPPAGSPGTTDDSDGDGIPNDWEIAHSHDPNNAADAGRDFDQDGLTTKQEYDLAVSSNNQYGNPLGNYQISTIQPPLGYTLISSINLVETAKNGLSLVSIWNSRISMLYNGQEITGPSSDSNGNPLPPETTEGAIEWQLHADDNLGGLIDKLDAIVSNTWSDNRRDQELQQALCHGASELYITQLMENMNQGPASSKSKRNGVREVSDKSFKIFKRERVVTPLPF
jgi:hypothetical protein